MKILEVLNDILHFRSDFSCSVPRGDFYKNLLRGHNLTVEEDGYLKENLG